MLLSLIAASASHADDKALAVIAAAKAATGGPGWDRLTGWHERGRHGDVSYDTQLDFRRYGARFATTVNGRTWVRAYNGKVAWDRDPAGKVTTSTDPAKLAEMRQSAYASTFAFFLSDRFPARFEYLGVQTDAGARFDVVRVTPTGATPFELWVDQATHLPARIIDRSGPKPVTGESSDYRQVGPVREPFHLKEGDGDPATEVTAEVESVELGPVDRRAFDPPS